MIQAQQAGIKMKKLLLLFLIPFLFLTPEQSLGQQKINTKIAVVNSPSLPSISNLITDFDFNKNVVYSNGKLSQITDVIGSVASSQSDTSKQPRYFINNGSGNNGYAHFRGTDKLTGALLTSSTNFTVVIVRRTYSGLADNDQLGVFENGGAGGGFSWIDKFTYASGGYFPTVSSVQGQYTYTKPSQWETIVFSHSSNNTKTYNSSGQLLLPYPNATLNPSTPTTSHTIGSSVDVNNFKGDICRILLYSRQLSDSEVNQLTAYMNSRYSQTYPVNFTSDGDSITATANGSLLQNWPTYSLVSMLPSYYLFLNQVAVTGYQSQDVLDSLQNKVISKYQSGCKNIFVVMIGHNNMTQVGYNEDTLYNQTSRICTRAHNVGYKVILMTTLYTTVYSTARTDSYNIRILAGYKSMGADTICNLNQCPHLTDPTNTTYFFDGMTHLSYLGAQTAAAFIQPFIIYYITH